MSPQTPETVLNALSQVMDRERNQDVVSAGLISGVTVHDGKAGFLITIHPSEKTQKNYLRAACERAVAAIPGITGVTAVMTAHNDQPIPPSPQSGYTAPRERAHWNTTPLPYVNEIIAVASGKGGVGKSTTTVNLALALRALGKRVGVLDADIYGPSLPHMLGISGQPALDDGKMLPHQAHGLVCMSMGLITGDEAAILRGPMISKALQQMLRFTQWGTEDAPLDVLLVDMPPGTGDIHLSMAQQVPLNGAIIVSTPQAVATIDARKCLMMFQKLDVPVLGVIENMSYFTDPTGARLEIFGAGGGQSLAQEMDVTFLGQIPLDMAIRQATDSGKAYGGEAMAQYSAIAVRLGV